MVEKSRFFFSEYFCVLRVAFFFVFPAIFGVELIGLTNHVIFTKDWVENVRRQEA